jgi:GNAT superfamily N-acetyltransferase
MTEPIIAIRPLTSRDRQISADAFAAQGWNKPVSLFERYLAESSSGKRGILIAEVGNEFAGYITVDWRPDYCVFKDGSFPEIADLNVLIRFQKRGIGARLMTAAEHLISEHCDTAGIRVGLSADYGSAQRLYVKRGYTPDGFGLSQRGRFVKFGDSITVDDDLTLGFTKSLK